MIGGRMSAEAPYNEIFADLVRSIMRAQAEILANKQRVKLESAPHQLINRHFAWLSLAYRQGQNRHLYDGVAGNAPIRRSALRAPSRVPTDVRAILRDRTSLPQGKSFDEFVQQEPTRISRLIIRAFLEIQDAKSLSHIDQERQTYFRLKSPLAIAFDYLTVPEMPGSRAYAQLTLRNFLFHMYKRFPGDLVDLPIEATFSIGDIEEALSHIWTSLRPRYFSSGEDKLPAEGRSPAGGLLRQYLAAKGMLWLRFRDASVCHRYLERQEILSETSEYEFARSEYLNRLPDLGEIINELWGIPIPIRGGETLFRGGLKLSSRGGLCHRRARRTRGGQN
jgi:hypothetical protein